MPQAVGELPAMQSVPRPPLTRVESFIMSPKSPKPKSGRRETLDQEHRRRVREAKGQVRAIRWERRLHRVLNDVLNELHVGASDPMAVHLQNYSRKVFGALRRTRKTRPVWRQKAMAKLDMWAAEHELPPEPFTQMKQAVIVLFNEMERKGELD